MSSLEQQVDECEDSSDDESYAPSEHSDAEEEHEQSDAEDKDEGAADASEPPQKKLRSDPEPVSSEGSKTKSMSGIDVDALWADFIGDTTDAKKQEDAGAQKATTCATKESAVDAAGPSSESEGDRSSASAETKPPHDSSEEQNGEKRTAPVSSSSTTSTPAQPKPQNAAFGSFKPQSLTKKPTPKTTGGFGAALGAMKKKTSVLAASADSWNAFKSAQNLDEELQTHNRGKDGYMERQDFLQRADLRQFELEKTDRASRRKPL